MDYNTPAVLSVAYAPRELVPNPIQLSKQNLQCACLYMYGFVCLVYTHVQTGPMQDVIHKFCKTVRIAHSLVKYKSS